MEICDGSRLASLCSHHSRWLLTDYWVPSQELTLCSSTVAFAWNHLQWPQATLQQPYNHNPHEPLPPGVDKHIHTSDTECPSPGTSIILSSKPEPSPALTLGPCRGSTVQWKVTTFWHSTKPGAELGQLPSPRLTLLSPSACPNLITQELLFTMFLAEPIFAAPFTPRKVAICASLNRALSRHSASSFLCLPQSCVIFDCHHLGSEGRERYKWDLLLMKGEGRICWP